MLKLGRVTKVKVLFLVLVFVFNFDLYKFSAAILEKGLLSRKKRYIWNMTDENLNFLFAFYYSGMRASFIQTILHVTEPPLTTYLL